ncbi:MAG: GNAT family N-acetyltransferase [Negativicutes bacterium]|nr:GNAT family N-acetyltransferase [Negativicutes bacterium]
MIRELSRQHYRNIIPLMKGRPEGNVRLLAVVDGTNPGRIYVDDIEQPRTALLWAIGSSFAVLGESNNPEFNSYLYDFLKNQLGPASLSLSGGTHFCLPFDEESWQDIFDQILGKVREDSEFQNIETLSYIFNRQNYLQTAKTQRMLPDNYEMKKIDASVLQNDTSQILREDILGDYWLSEEAFLAKGFGYCVTSGHHVLSVCFSGYVSGVYHDCVLRTYNDSDRNEGLATLAARAYLEHCIKIHLSPVWNTTSYNVASQRIAEKCGFELYRKCPAYLFPFDIL